MIIAAVSAIPGAGTREYSLTLNTRVHKVGRNEPCFCGTRKKYKRCCGVL
ncbi:MAG: SEC-C domain-containing protein [Methylophilaceae bacterium]|nr:SEC-C domain-containing protein [Methylophilaceae bacterium]